MVDFQHQYRPYVSIASLSPRLEIDCLDAIPFSESFPEFINHCICEEKREKNSLHFSSEVSYDIENIANIQDVVPEWDDDEVDEILIMSPKVKRPEISLEGAPEMKRFSMQSVSLHDFEILQPILHLPCFPNSLLCKKRDSGKVYALKFLQESARRHSSEEAVMGVIRQLEAPFLPYLHWSFQENGRLYMVIDYNPRTSLHDEVKRRGSLETHRAIFYSCEIIEALSTLHVSGIIHRDINPGNIMIDTNGHVVLMNFSNASIINSFSNGISHSAGYEAGIGAMLEQHEYQAPEILLGWAHTYAVDCWSFGGLLSFMFFGKHPFTEISSYDSTTDLQNKIIYDPITFESLKSIHPDARDLIVKCLERNPAIRPNVRGIKKHSFFSRVDWEERLTPAGLRDIGYMESIQERQKSCHTLRPSQVARVGPVTLQDIEEISELTSPSISIKSSGPSEQGEDSPSIFDNTGHLLPENSEDRIDLARSQERMTSFWDAIDREQLSAVSDDSVELEASRSVSYSHAIKLRKQRSLIYPHRLFASSSTSFKNKLRKKSRSTSALRQFKKPVLDLPIGIQQLGSGIGFTYDVSYESRSKASLCTVAPTVCHTIFKKSLGQALGLGQGSCKTKHNLAISPASVRDEGSIESSLSSPREYNNSSWIPSPPVSTASHMLMTASTSPLTDGGPLTPITLNCGTPIFTSMETTGFQDGYAREVKEGDSDRTLRLVPTTVSGLRLSFPPLTPISDI